MRLDWIWIHLVTRERITSPYSPSLLPASEEAKLGDQCVTCSCQDEREKGNVGRLLSFIYAALPHPTKIRSVQHPPRIRIDPSNSLKLPAHPVCFSPRARKEEPDRRAKE